MVHGRRARGGQPQPVEFKSTVCPAPSQSSNRAYHERITAYPKSSLPVLDLESFYSFYVGV